MSATIWLTIGVAIYKVEPYLRACLDSIAAQDLTGVEVLLLDDGSPDACPAICDEYAARYPAFTAIHQPNSGVSTARNAIIERARGTWLSFVDGDDLLAPDALSTFRRHAASDADVVVFDHQEFEDGKTPPPHQRQHEEMVLQGREALLPYTTSALIRDEETRKLYVGFSVPSVTAKLFRMDFLRREHIRFDPNLPKAQDTVFTFLYCHLVNRLVVVPESTYLYRRNAGSITKRFSPKMADYYVALMNAIQGVMERFGDAGRPVIADAFYRLVLCQLCVVLELGSHHPDCPWDRERRLAYIRTYCDQPFFADALAHYDSLPEYVRTWVPWKQELLSHDYNALYDQYAARLRRFRRREALEKNPVTRWLMKLKRALKGGGMK